MEPLVRPQPGAPRSLQEEYALWCATLLDLGRSLPVHGPHCEGHPFATITVLNTPEHLRAIERAEHARTISGAPAPAPGAANNRPAANPRFNFQRTRLAEAAAVWCREGRNSDFLLLPGQQLLEGTNLLDRCRSDLTVQEIAFVEASIAVSPRPAHPIASGRWMILAGLVSALAVVSIWRLGLPITPSQRANSGEAPSPRREIAVPPAPIQPPSSDTASLVAEAADKSRAGEAFTATGNLPDALAAYREGLAVQQKLVALEPHNLARQRDLADGWNRIADILQQQGNTPDAITAYHEAAAITQVCVGALPADLDLQGRLFSNALSIGNLLLAQNDFPGALTAFRRGTAVAQRLCDRDPENPGWQRDLSISLQGISDSFDGQGDHEEAVRQSRRSLRIRQHIAEDDPTNTEAHSDLVAAEWKTGDLMLAQTDVDGALPHYAAALAIQQKLVASDVSRPEWQRSLATAYERTGQALLAKNELVGPEEAFTHVLDIRRMLLAQETMNLERQHDVFLALTQLGDAQVLVSNLPAALKSYREALSIQQQLGTFAAGDFEWQRGLAETQDKIGQILEAEDPAGALPFYREAQATYERLTARNPTDDTLMETAATVSYHLGRASTRRRPADLETARRSLEHARDVLLHLRAAESTKPSQGQADTLKETEQLLAQMQ